VGVVHRDLKTANLMRDRDGVVRVMDFGIAKQHGTAGEDATVTATGTLMGTPEYMSPEQLRGDEVDFRSDLYSLGIVLYEIFSGKLPFRGDTAVATILRQLNEAPFLDLPALPESLRPVLARALAKDPADRHANATAMCGALEGAWRASGPSTAGLNGRAPGTAGLDDETRPVMTGPRPEGARLVWMAVSQVAVAALAVHLVSAGGVQPGVAPSPPPALPSAPVPTATPTPAPPPPAPPPVVEVTARPARPSPAPRATPAPTPAPTPILPGPAVLPDLEATAPAPLPPRPSVDHSRVYDEDEVDVKPRHLAGMTAPYPEWGPKLPKGRSVSITASYVVTEEGLVTDIRVEEGGGVLEAVLLELSRWRFEPGMKDGVPVKVRVRWKHTFLGG
jgi:serine/threonine-protein kinase